MGLSLFVLSSATANIASDPLFFVKKHLFSIGLGVICAIIIIAFDYSILLKYYHYIYGLTIILLLVVQARGFASHGAQQWISLGPFVLQPSEIAKVMMIICFASFLVKRQGEMKTLKDLLPPVAYFSVPTRNCQQNNFKR